MAIELSDLIFSIRMSLSDLPVEDTDDPQIMLELTKSEAYVNKLARTTTTESDLTQTIQALALYYSYLNYTSRSERLLGTLPTSTAIKLSEYKQQAYMWLKQVSELPIKPDLTVDEDMLKKMKPTVVVPTYSLVGDDVA